MKALLTGFVEDSDPCYNHAELIELLLLVPLQEHHEGSQLSLREDALQGSCGKRNGREIIHSLTFMIIIKTMYTAWPKVLYMKGLLPIHTQEHWSGH